MFNLLSSQRPSLAGGPSRLLVGSLDFSSRPFNAFPFSLSGFQRRPDSQDHTPKGRPLASVCHNLDRGRHSDYLEVTTWQQKIIAAGARTVDPGGGCVCNHTYCSACIIAMLQYFSARRAPPRRPRRSARAVHRGWRTCALPAGDGGSAPAAGRRRGPLRSRAGRSRR